MRRLAVLGLLILAILPTATCSPSFEQQRSAAVNYLSAYDQIDNDLNRTVLTIAANLGLMPNPLQLSGTVNQLVSAGEGAMQRTNGLKVPNDTDIRNHYETSKKILQDQIDALKGMRSAIAVGNQNAYVQSYKAFTDTGPRVASLHRSEEAIMVRFNITDAEVNYQMRGK